jgi:DNA-binding NtrC family response regulator
VERGILMAKDRFISAADLGLSQAAAPAATSEEMTLEQSEKLFIQKVLARHAGDVRKAAEQLGMSRSALYRRLQHFGL